MPHMVVCGRQWSTSSDRYVTTSILVAGLHLFWIAGAIALMATSTLGTTGSSCDKPTWSIPLYVGGQLLISIMGMAIEVRCLSLWVFGIYLRDNWKHTSLPSSNAFNSNPPPASRLASPASAAAAA